MDLKELQEDVKEIKSDVKAITVTLERNTVSLEHHVKRTDLNEERISKVENWILGLLTSILIAVIGYFFKT